MGVNVCPNGVCPFIQGVVSWVANGWACANGGGLGTTLVIGNTIFMAADVMSGVTGIVWLGLDVDWIGAGRVGSLDIGNTGNGLASDHHCNEIISRCWDKLTIPNGNHDHRHGAICQGGGLMCRTVVWSIKWKECLTSASMLLHLEEVVWVIGVCYDCHKIQRIG